MVGVDQFVVHDAVVGVADNQFARLAAVGEEVCDALGVVERLAGDNAPLIEQLDLPIAAAVGINPDGSALITIPPR